MYLILIANKTNKQHISNRGVRVVEKVCSKATMEERQVHLWRERFSKYFRNGWFPLHYNTPAHRTLVFKECLASTSWWLWSIRHIPWTCHHPSFSCFRCYEVFWEDEIPRATRKSLQNNYNTDRHRKMVCMKFYQKLYNIDNIFDWSVA
jgi:hypothetical protein